MPVPVGTGGSWNDRRKLGEVGAIGMIDPDRVRLSILVQPDHLWIGLSRVNELVDIPRDGKEWTALAAKLAEHKKSAFFSDRDDLDIAGERVTYGEVVKAVAAATDAGFGQWIVVSPGELAARPTL